MRIRNETRYLVSYNIEVEESSKLRETQGAVAVGSSAVLGITTSAYRLKNKNDTSYNRKGH
jgi:hypothetical protein